ncbi:DNA-directed RNA polymerase subunit Rpb7 [Bodo saltans virus]|uniref:DNA-directed RNA polymerase subunit Rpb7 n=1 Tax=Bodo saltans virus TaxID=2024608 RepID=A0A2H4UV02_9VIRU|nr:DNA-directed RNA polymerase subunit Rpb7 [Bodo saltans virus]ATZ80689.1 DNA-directed RNA polymerase subunit Rpb7 [Bodo saltans virus]
MRKEIYENLKNNLIRKYRDKCFKSYGYISKIYKILSKEGGLIPAENPLSTAIYKVEFLCKICRPLKGSIIICKVVAINKSVIYLVNGPIQVMIFSDDKQINKKNFIYDEEKNVLVGKIGENQGVKILKGSYVRVKCIDVRVEDGTNRIIIWGIMDSVATEDDINRANDEMESDSMNQMDYAEHIENDASEEMLNKYINEENEDTYEDSGDDVNADFGDKDES